VKYVNLGRSGLKVSRIALGCMSFGLEARAWRVDEAAGRPIIQRALELGVNFFDTADIYGAGESEMMLGRALADFARRDEVVIATKLYYPMRPERPGPVAQGDLRGHRRQPSPARHRPCRPLSDPPLGL